MSNTRAPLKIQHDLKNILVHVLCIVFRFSLSNSDKGDWILNFQFQFIYKWIFDEFTHGSMFIMTLCMHVCNLHGL